MVCNQMCTINVNEGGALGVWLSSAKFVPWQGVRGPETQWSHPKGGEWPGGAGLRLAGLEGFSSGPFLCFWTSADFTLGGCRVVVSSGAAR